MNLYVLTSDSALDENLLFLQLMSQDQKWSGQTRSNEKSKPSRQTVDIFNLERQILCDAPRKRNQLYNTVLDEAAEEKDSTKKWKYLSGNATGIMVGLSDELQSRICN